MRGKRECTGYVLVVLRITSFSYEVFYECASSAHVFLKPGFIIPVSSRMDYSLCLDLTKLNLFQQKLTSVTLPLIHGKRQNRLSQGFNLRSCLQYALGAGLGPEMETNLVWNGPWGQSTDLSKRKTYHTPRRMQCYQDLQERSPTCCYLKWLLTGLQFIVPSLFFFPWWGINNLN